MLRFCWTAVFLIALAALVPPASTAVDTVPPEVAADAERHDYAWGDRGRLIAETFELGEALVGRLAEVPVDGRILVTGFPFAPGERGDVEFVRFDVYDADANVIELGPHGEIALPRSPRLHFVGEFIGDREVRLGLSLDPDGGSLRGVVSHPSGVLEIAELRGRGASSGLRLYEIGTPLADRLGIETQVTCDTPDVPEPFDPAEWADRLAGRSAGRSVGPSEPGYRSGHDYEATVAFDTDGEFLADYGNNTGTANAAIGDFIVSLNVIYERDLGLRLLQGDTVLRTNPNSDPYISSNTRDQLDEVGAWWEANKPGVDRVWVALLSGKGFSNGGSCSGAGIAWVDQYCDTIVSGGPFDGGSYSATQVLRCVALDGSANTGLIGHELGHNAGSSHTHCYSPEVDQCYNAETGCYSGAVSCPDHSGEIPGITPGKGSMMSYCNFSPPNGAGCGSNENFLHPTVIARILLSLTAASPACVDPAACSVGDDDLVISAKTDSAPGPTLYEACNSITFGPGYTALANSNVTARAPVVTFVPNVTLDGPFTVENVTP